MPSYPKHQTFRSPKLLALAKDCPECVWCHAPQVGQVVACHSNSLRHGKGSGHKAHDLPAYLCDRCHALVDGRTSGLTREERDAMLFEAIYLTTLWLLETGHLEVA